MSEIHVWSRFEKYGWYMDAFLILLCVDKIIFWGTYDYLFDQVVLSIILVSFIQVIVNILLIE